MERTDLNINDFARLVEESRRVLDQLRTDGAPAENAEDAAEAAELSGSADGADGLIRAKVRAGGHLEPVQIDPRALRMGAQALGEQIAIVVNAALDDLRNNASTQAGLTPVDTEALNEQLLEVQDQAVHRMSTFVDGLDEALDKIARAAGTFEDGR